MATVGRSRRVRSRLRKLVGTITSGTEMTPATQALAYRIWHYCTPRGWNCTHTEVADALGVSRRRVFGAVQSKRWAGRFRASMIDNWATSYPHVNTVIDGRNAAQAFRGNQLDE